MSPKRKIFHLIVSLERGGCEMALLRMLPHLQEEFEHTIITLKKSGSLAPDFKKKNISIIELNQKNFFDFFSYLKLRKILTENQPDLVFTHLLHADIVGRLFVQYIINCKVISSLVTTYNSKKYWPAVLFERCSALLATGYMANSNSVKQTYIEKFHVPEHKITVVPCGIDTDKYKNNIDTSLRTSLGLKEDDFVIICVANLFVNKGHQFLLEAFEKLFVTNPQVKLLLVGTGPHEQTLRNQVETYSSKESIFFLGKRTDVPQLLATSNVFVLATFFEGMSNAIMEAMASHLPVITTNITENRELIIDKKTGLLCPIKDSQSLYMTIQELCADPQKKASLGENAAQYIEKKYSLNQAVQEWRNFYLKMSQKV